MTVPSSGQLHLSKIASEKHFDNYNETSLPTPPYSLKDVSTSGNSGGSGVSFEATNTASVHKPDGSTPHRMGEFYGYDHDAVTLSSFAITPLSAPYPKSVFACGEDTTDLGFFTDADASDSLSVGDVGYTSNTGATFISAGNYGIGSSQSGTASTRITIGSNGAITFLASC